MGIIKVDLDKEGYLLVTHAGETNRFVEIEPGMYQNLREGRTQDYYGGFKTIVFDTDPLGNMMLMSDGPMTYSKAPWYAAASFTFMALLGAVVFIAGSLIYWSIISILRLIRRHKKQQQAKAAMVACWTAVVYGVLTCGVILGVLSNGQVDPVYGLPKAALGILPSWTPLLDFLPKIMAVVGALLVASTISIWELGYWKIVSRIHYTIFTVAAALLLWIFVYWNIL